MSAHVSKNHLENFSRNPLTFPKTDNSPPKLKTLSPPFKKHHLSKERVSKKSSSVSSDKWSPPSDAVKDFIRPPAFVTSEEIFLEEKCSSPPS